MNTPNINFDTTKLLNSSNASKMQEVLKKDFANFFLGNQNPLVTLVHGIQLIRFSLHILQKEFNKLAENNIINQEKKLVNLKDFNSLLCENNFQDIQLSFFNPIKNDVYLLNPMTETELTYLEMNVDTQNTLINLSKYNNINNNSNFLGIPQNFSPFPMAGHQFISPKFTPIINRNYNHQLLHPMNLMNANNMLGYNSIQSNFSSPATNYNPYSNHNEFLLQRLLENMNNPNLNQSLDKNILNNVINNNNINNNPNNNLITKMEIDESANFTKKWTK